jgi:hypothetical protein
MDALEMLADQHREMESVFDQYETALRATTRRRLCRKLANLVAVHTAIEEILFYPAVTRGGIAELLPTALAAHASVQCTIAEILQMEAASANTIARMSALRLRMARHALDEEKTLFPRARELLTRPELEMLGVRMESLAEQLICEGPRERIAAQAALA